MINRKQTAIDLKMKGLTYTQIGNQLGISRQRVQQMTSPPKAIREIVIKRAGGRCQKCQIKLGTHGNIHHEGGEDYDYNDIDNLQYLCTSCHISLHLKDQLPDNSYINGRPICTGYPNEPHLAQAMHKSGKLLSGGQKAQSWRCSQCGRSTIRTPNK